ncbi:adhesion G-protein coupled receptor F3 [Parambassis ranga]|uniref:Adhesion G-protein coupled receptor F3 n=1 Tax=Parambassis ranga TaxID=210632 RepID=A0A6P7HF64_9TELE|nr:adhesion G-protein coupled receptor F3-like [Parambassis ranga]
MWIFIFLHILGLNICQATENNSTQMHYVKLTIDWSVLEDKESILQSPFQSKVENFILETPNITTVCEAYGQDSTICTCKPWYRWSDDVCQSNKCCGQTPCIFAKNSGQMCVSNSSVTITGTIHLPDTDYKDCLVNKATSSYKDCHNKALVKLKEKYSTFSGFDSLTITEFSSGSVIARFTTTIVSAIDPQKLIDISQSLNASMQLETRGIVNLVPPNGFVPYNGEATFICETKVDLGGEPKWTLRKPDNTEFEITTGTQAKLTGKDRKIYFASLTHVTELWAGEYLCEYSQKKDKINITHIANATIDISLLPKIEAYTKPSFPRCTTATALLRVKAVCEIQKSTEPYTVEWNCTGCTPQKSSNADYQFYEAEQFISCDKKNVFACKFSNRANQSETKEVNINIITFQEKYCAAAGGWEDTKPGFTATLKCTNMAGLRRRRCSINAEWQHEVSDCVHAELNKVLQNALIVDIGRGFLDDNVKNVFDKLQNVTDNTLNINTYPNINASVTILTTVNEKLKTKPTNCSVKIPDQSTIENFLASADNLLKRSLESAWTSKPSDLADMYLKSVEDLIKVANLTNGSIKDNLAVDICNDTSNHCNVSVLNVSINFGSSGSGTLKTAGFSNIDSYLTNNESIEYETNSIVVSATTEKNETNVKITMDFQLHKRRPRNVKIRCVSRDPITRQWSDEGCKWGGPSNENQCTCEHLSSFAVLMSKIPLELPWASEITTAGLSVSVVSLVLSLLIELIVWSSVVKTNTLYLRHVAHINISLSLLVANCCFLASANPENLSQIWCSTVVVVKHFCYLSMFFWMLCLSSTLLHQAVFLFHKVSKKQYLRYSLVLGYVCPFLIVLVTFLTNGAGGENDYYSKDTCWLVYKGLLKGSIYTFILPVGTIVFFNVFSMVVVIMKLLDHHNAEKLHEKEKSAAKTVLRTVVLLTPIFGVTWLFGFGVMLIDLTDGPIALVVNYTFILLNSFQGLFIFLTTCLGDKMTRDALLTRFKKKMQIPGSISDSTMKTDSTMKK